MHGLMREGRREPVLYSPEFVLEPAALHLGTARAEFLPERRMSLIFNFPTKVAYRSSPFSADVSGTIFKNFLKLLRFPLTASALR